MRPLLDREAEYELEMTCSKAGAIMNEMMATTTKAAIQ
jgi:hypothetical protein